MEITFDILYFGTAENKKKKGLIQCRGRNLGMCYTRNVKNSVC